MQTASWHNPRFRRDWFSMLSMLALGTLLCFSGKASLAATGVEFDRMGFYQAGDEGDENPPQEWSDPRLKNRFAADSTRYVYTLVSLKNLQWQNADQEIVIHLRYYHSDGRLFGAPVIEYEVPQDWEFTELWNGWGWPEAGKWSPDRYRVELWLDNRKKIGASHFTIY